MKTVFVCVLERNHLWPNCLVHAAWAVVLSLAEAREVFWTMYPAPAFDHLPPFWGSAPMFQGAQESADSGDPCSFHAESADDGCYKLVARSARPPCKCLRAQRRVFGCSMTGVSRWFTLRRRSLCYTLVY